MELVPSFRWMWRCITRLICSRMITFQPETMFLVDFSTSKSHTLFFENIRPNTWLNISEGFNMKRFGRPKRHTVHTGFLTLIKRYVWQIPEIKFYRRRPWQRSIFVTFGILTRFDFNTRFYTVHRNTVSPIICMRSFFFIFTSKDLKRKTRENNWHVRPILNVNFTYVIIMTD